MKYSIKVNEVRAKEGSNIKGFATVVFGDSFKITNIAILENKDKGEFFVSMPRYRSNERDESNGVTVTENSGISCVLSCFCVSSFSGSLILA